MIKKICFILLLFLLTKTHTSWAQTEFRISPPVIEISLGRGGAKVFSFELANDNKDKQLRFRISPLDLDVDRDGGMQFIEVGKSSYSCSKWIKLESQEVLLGPGKAKKIIGKLSVPAAISAGGYYSAIICELVPEKPPRVETGAVIHWRVASLIKVSVLGGRVEKEASLDDFNLRTIFEKEEKKNGLTFVASLKNEGNIHINAQGKLIILTPERRRKGEIDFEVGTGTVVPGHIRDFTAVYDKFLSEGDYIARATFRYGGSSSLEKEIPFSVIAGKAERGEEFAVEVSSIKLIPEELSLRIPRGGFRMVGFSVQNQRMDNLRLQLSLAGKSGIQDWFGFEFQEVNLEAGRETKVSIKINIPQDAKEGEYQTRINISPSLINEQGQPEKLEPLALEIKLEIPKF